MNRLTKGTIEADVANAVVRFHREQQKIIKNDFALAERLNVPVVTLHGDVAGELIRYARENRIAQVVIGHSDRSKRQEFVKGSIINTLTRELRTIDILIVAAPTDDGPN